MFYASYLIFACEILIVFLLSRLRVNSISNMIYNEQGVGRTSESLSGYSCLKTSPEQSPGGALIHVAFL